MNTERRPVHMPPDAASLRALVEMHRESADYREALARVTAAQEPAAGDAAQPPADSAWQPVAAAQRPATGVTVDTVEAGGSLPIRCPQCGSGNINMDPGIWRCMSCGHVITIVSAPAAPGLPDIPLEWVDALPRYESFDEPTRSILTSSEAVAVRRMSALLRTGGSLPTAAADAGPDAEAVGIAGRLPSPRLSTDSWSGNHYEAIWAAADYVRRKAAP